MMLSSRPEPWAELSGSDPVGPLQLRGSSMTDKPKTTPPETGEDAGIDRPRLTPQGRAADGGQDETDPQGGVKKGQGDKAEG